MAQASKITTLTHAVFYGVVSIIGAGMYLTGNVPEEQIIGEIKANKSLSTNNFGVAGSEQKKKDMVDFINRMKNPNHNSKEVDKLLSKGKE